MIGVGAHKKAFGNTIIASVRKIASAEIAAAHMHADRNLRGTARQRAVEALDIRIDQRIGIAAGGLDLGSDRGITQERDRDLVELDIAAAGADKIGDFLPIECSKIIEE